MVAAGKPDLDNGFFAADLGKASQVGFPVTSSYLLTKKSLECHFPLQRDATLGFDADQYSFFGALGPESKLDGALEVCCCNTLKLLQVT